jgi:DHA1 family bicyclomycin/chloramphenicol resistance-like MFS transporter
MHPEAATLWRGPRWALALLLATLSMLAPFAIDAYLPAFDGMARSLQATPVQMQQTLSVFLFGFAAMNLFHGALSDSVGRRPVVLASLAVFTLASVGCALSPSVGWLLLFRALQGMSAGGGMVVARAIIRDLYPPAQAQRVMSQVTIFFGAAPAVAPMIGGLLYVYLDWHAVFWLLALIGAAQFGVMWKRLPESLHPSQRQPVHLGHLLRGYWQVGASVRFFALALASAVPFNGMFVYVLAAPAWLGGHLGLQPTQFFWFFTLSVSGVMGGAWVSGRLAGRLTLERQVGIGLAVMGAAATVNVAAHFVWQPHVAWALIPVSVYSFGWSLSVPAVTLMLLDLVPERRGMASSVQSFLGALINAVAAGMLVPLVMGSALALALASAALCAAGTLAWLWVRERLPRAQADGH